MGEERGGRVFREIFPSSFKLDLILFLALWSGRVNRRCREGRDGHSFFLFAAAAADGRRYRSGKLTLGDLIGEATGGRRERNTRT